MTTSTAESDSASSSAHPKRAKRPPLRKAFRVLLLVGALALLCSALAPTILSTRPGRLLAVSVANRFLPCRVEIEDLKAGWAKGVEARGLKVVGPRGGEPFTAKRLLLDASLLSLARGDVKAAARLEQPRATIRRLADGSVEVAGFRIEPGRAMGATHSLERERSAGAGARPGGKRNLLSLDVAVSGGEILLSDEAARTEAVLGEISLAVRSKGEYGPLAIECDARLRSGGRSGSLRVAGALDPSRGEGEAKIGLETFDLGALSPLLAATGAFDRASGLLEGTLYASRAADGSVASGGELRATDLRLEGGKFGSPPFVEPSVTVRPAFRFEPSTGKVSAEGLEVRTSFASLVGRGEASGSGAEASAEASIELECDLAEGFARARAFFPPLPAATGRVHGKLSVSGSEGELRFEGTAAASGFSLSGGPIPPGFRAPESLGLRLTGSYAAAARQATLQRGRLEAGPFAADFTGSVEAGPDGPSFAGRAKFSGDLAAAEGVLHPFVPKGLSLAGAFSSEIVVTGNPSGTRLGVEAGVADLSVRRGGGAEARREKVEFHAGTFHDPAKGTLEVEKVVLACGSIQAEGSGRLGLAPEAPLELHGGLVADLADLASLARATFPESPEAQGSLRADLDLRGTRSATRFSLKAVLGKFSLASPTGSPPPLDATLDCSGSLAAGSLRATIESGKISAPFATLDFGGMFETGETADARFSLSGDLARADPYLRPYLPEGTNLTGAVRLDGTAKSSTGSASFGFTLKTTGLAAGPVEADVTGSFAKRTGLPAIEARGTLRGDLASIAPLARLANPRMDLAGSLRADFRTSKEGEKENLEATFVGENLRIAGKPRPEGSPRKEPPDLFDRLAAAPAAEKEARLDLSATFDRAADRLSIGKADFRAAGAGLEAKARGTVEQVSTSALLEGGLDLAADMEALRAAAGAFFPADFRLSGKASGRLVLGGSLRPDPLRGASASGVLELPSADFAGNSFRGGRLDVALAGGALRVRDLRGTLNGGEVTATGAVEFVEDGPPRVALEGTAKGVRVERGLVVPLAHVVPIFAASNPKVVQVAATASGDFSVRGRGLDWKALQTSLAGEGSVTLGAGSISGSPAVVPLLAALNGRSSFSFRDIAGAFRIADGRLATDGIRVGSEEASLTLVGSTGLDGSLDYRIAVDLPEKVERKAWGAALEQLFGKGGLPVGLAGSVSSPKLALKAPDLKETAGDLLKGGLERLLEERRKREAEKKKKETGTG